VRHVVVILTAHPFFSEVPCFTGIPQGGGALFVFALTSLCMPGLAFFPSLASAQSGSVLQRWIEHHGPVQDPTAADVPVGVRHDSGGWMIYTGGSHTFEDGRSAVMSMANRAAGHIADPNIAVNFGRASVPMPEEDQSFAVAMTTLETGVYWKNLTCVIGHYLRAENPGFVDCIVGGFGFQQDPEPPHDYIYVHLEGTSWPFIYTEGRPRVHTPVSIDGGWMGDPTVLMEPRVVFAVHSSAYTLNSVQYAADSTVVVLDEFGDEVARITLPERVRDVRLDLEHIWIVSEHDNGSILIRGYDQTLTTLVVHQTFSLPGYTCSPRLLRHVINGASLGRINGELVIAGTRRSNPSDADILLLRFGWDALNHAWTFLWPAQLYDNGGYDQPMDVAAVHALDSSNADFHTVVYIAAQSESLRAGSEFTTLCYIETALGAVGLEWEARHEPGSVGAALSVSAATQDVGGVKWVIAIVSGAVDNASAYWDWMTVKYNHLQPLNYPTIPKTPRWDIRYPVMSQDEDDMVATGVTHFILSGTVWAYVTGTNTSEASGVDILTTFYEETVP
jgi:hypothetical protein